jgi:DNA-binding transcriptional ArsR family regulator
MKNKTLKSTSLKIAEHADFFKILGNSDRLTLLYLLAVQKKCVADIEIDTNILQPTLSQQLGVLRRSKLVETEKIGKQVFYSVTNNKVKKILKIFDLSNGK